MFDKIYELIKKMKITIHHLAKCTKISSGLFYDWKSGRCNPSIVHLIKIADFFGVSLDYLTGRTTKMQMYK